MYAACAARSAPPARPGFSTGERRMVGRSGGGYESMIDRISPLGVWAGKVEKEVPVLDGSGHLSLGELPDLKSCEPLFVSGTKISP